MLTLKCTKKVQAYLKLKESDLAEPVEGEEGFGAWYVNQFYVDRRKCLIFMNEKTLLSFFLYGVKKTNTRKDTFPELCLNGVFQLLKIEGFSGKSISQFMDNSQDFRYMKTTDRKALGNLNDLMFMYEHMILSEGGLEYCDLTEIIRKMNRTPQKNIGWGYSIDKAREILGEISS
ncbi:hypothetical protein [Marinimicrobium sp. ABcell2]|uniref:DUF6933 domain-containing protein n=1 Tax=Marinimicrobium sp. ABcell2 TaxID=3069751 RepID=UPI0027B83368|nr:hypothetical protein [Marinimicrobium sp. ABcell2]MDQ2077941.1 hypothetical protein [Marinimicrobium sp. ABcell2]